MATDEGELGKESEDLGKKVTGRDLVWVRLALVCLSADSLETHFGKIFIGFDTENLF